MATLLLDTTVIIDINNKKGRRQLLRDLVNQGNSLACSPINITEVYAGLRPHEETSTNAFLSRLDLFPHDPAKLAGHLKRDDRKRAQTLNLGDVMIAATALHNGVALLTDNTKDFVTGYIVFRRPSHSSSHRDLSNWPASEVHRDRKERDRILTRVGTGGIPAQCRNAS